MTRALLVASICVSAILVSSARAQEAPAPTAALAPICVTVAYAITVEDGSYGPSSVTSNIGMQPKWSWFWSNTTEESVTSTDIPLFSSPLQVQGTYSFKFFAAGTFRYHSKADLQQHGNVRVKMCTATQATRTAGAIVEYSTKHHIGWVSDIEVKHRGDLRWHWLGYGLTGTQLTFHATRTGTYYLRARLRRTLSGKTSRFSPAQPIRFS